MSQEPLYGPKHGADFVRARTIETHVQIEQVPHFTKFTRKMPWPKSTSQTLSEPQRSKCMSNFRKSHLEWKSTGEMPVVQSVHPDQCTSLYHFPFPTCSPHFLICLPLFTHRVPIPFSNISKPTGSY